MQDAGFELSNPGTFLENIQPHSNSHLSAQNTSSGSVSPLPCGGKNDIQIIISE